MDKYVKTFKALSHETRLSIMALLSQGEFCVCQIEEILKISQVKVSRHLAILKNAGLLADRRKGLWAYYSLVPPSGKMMEKVSEMVRVISAAKPALKINKAKLKSFKGKC